MDTQTFDEIVKEATGSTHALLEEFSVAAYAIRSHNPKIMIDGCKALIELTHSYGLSFGLNLKTKAIETLVNKAKEYALSGDRLYNFKCNYDWQDETPYARLTGYMEKHLVSCADLITGKLKATPEMVAEKMGDCLNYSVLLYAVIKERYAKC